MVRHVIDPHGAPAYRQIAAILRGRIADGTWPPGTELPSEPDLAVEFGVGRDTVVNALALLRAEGLVITRRGFRTRVRQQQDLEYVPLDADATVTARMPTPEERTSLDIGDGVPVLVIGDEVYPADRYGAKAPPPP